ncbi:MAG: ribosomal-processing cysteine protease Prp [Firmicutes bacterium]|nr:ribosomal-processing cysteine protease Prp [Bacillota bacterium]
MIKIIINEENEITISGHSGYEEAGKDIVCASVSSIAITTINGILSIDSEALNYETSDGYIKILINKHSNIIDALLQNMINLFKELEKDYNKYVKIEEVR